jgi:hypothetical protein
MLTFEDNEYTDGVKQEIFGNEISFWSVITT